MVLPRSLAVETVETEDEGDRRAAQAVAEGAVLATYRFVGHKSEDDGGRISRLVVLGVGLDPAPPAGGSNEDRGSPVLSRWRVIW